MVVESIVSVAIVGAIVQVIKKTDIVSKRFLPVVAGVVGILLGIVAVYVPGNLLHEGILPGLGVGLAAAGSYDVLKKTLMSK